MCPWVSRFKCLLYWIKPHFFTLVFEAFCVLPLIYASPLASNYPGTWELILCLSLPPHLTLHPWSGHASSVQQLKLWNWIFTEHLLRDRNFVKSSSIKLSALEELIISEAIGEAGQRDRDTNSLNIQSYLGTHQLQNSSNPVLVAFWWREKMFRHSVLAQDFLHLLELQVTMLLRRRKMLHSCLFGTHWFQHLSGVLEGTVMSTKVPL